MRTVIVFFLMATTAMGQITNVFHFGDYSTNIIPRLTPITNGLLSVNNTFTFCASNITFTLRETAFSNMTVATTISTNEYRPKQFKSISIYATYPATSEETWLDQPDGMWFGGGYVTGKESRDNPDVKIVETHKIKALTFTHDGKPFSVVLSDEIVDKKTYRRTVKTEEQWKEGK